MLADDVLELRGRAERTEVVGEDQSGFRVEWWYPDRVYTMARRSSGGITAYRVVEIRVGASQEITGGPTEEDSSTHLKKSYRVQPGDTLYGISRAHAVSLDQLMRWNSLGPNDAVRPGDELVIWERRSGETN